MLLSQRAVWGCNCLFSRQNEVVEVVDFSASLFHVFVFSVCIFVAQVGLELTV